MQEVEVEDRFPTKLIVGARQYGRGRRILAICRGMAAALVLVGIIRGGVARAVLEWAEGALGTAAAATGLYVGILLLLISLVLLPLDLYAGHIRERAFGLSPQGLGGWLADRAKGWGLQAILGIPVGVVLLRMIERWPEGWWIGAAAGGLGLSLLLTAVGPLLIDPLFLRFIPLEEGPLKEGVLSLGSRAGVPVRQVWVAGASRRTRKANAYLAGIGRTRRIVLFDTLTSGMGLAEALAVVAHEMGHWRRRHIGWEIAISVLVGTIGFALLARLLEMPAALAWAGAQSPHHPLVLPLLSLAGGILGVLAMPALSALSRRFERQADADALELTGDPAACIRVEESLVRTNLLEPEPPRWAHWIWGTHPAPLERIRQAEAWALARREGRPCGPEARLLAGGGAAPARA